MYGLSNAVHGCCLSQFPYATVTFVTPEYHHEIRLTFLVILSLYTTQSTHTHPWTYVDTLGSRAHPHPHTVTHDNICVHLCTYTYCLTPYCLSPSCSIVLPPQHSHHTSLSMRFLTGPKESPAGPPWVRQKQLWRCLVGDHV
jgi:hypothetical protein